MRTVTGAAAAIVFIAGAASAFAAPPAHLTDVQFIAANRCLGLMSAKALTTPDAEALRSLLKGEGARSSYIHDKADQARADAEAEAARGGAENIAHLTAERDGVCHSLVATSTAATTSSGHSL